MLSSLIQFSTVSLIRWGYLGIIAVECVGSEMEFDSLGLCHMGGFVHFALNAKFEWFS